jgi:hypothetical protein
MSLMPGYDNGNRPAPGVGSLLLLAGVALAAGAAYLLATKPGQMVRRQFADRAGNWTAQAAEALAQGREKVIAAVEEQKAAGAGSVRQKPL